MSNQKRDDGIRRRDFINGMLLAAGTAAVGGSFPMRAMAGGTTYPCDGAIGTDPNVLRGGNLPSVFNIAHWLRDGRLTFKTNSVLISSSPCDSYQGSQPLNADNGNYDVIIVGAGMSGCSAAFFITQQRPGTKILILDGQVTPGGNANRDDTSPIVDVASTATAYAVQPYNAFLNNIYNTTGILWQNYIVPSPFYSYYFDSQTPYVNPGTNSWNIDTYVKGLDSVPYPMNIVNDLKAARADLMNWYHKPGAPTDPADNSDPKYDYLSPMTFDSYLTQTKGFHPAVSDFYTRYAVDALDGTTSQASAYTSISFLGAEYFPEFAYPGGNSGMLRHIIKWLIPGAINGSSDADLLANPYNLAAMDAANNNVRIRQGAMVLRGDTNNSSASVIYFSQGQFYQATAKAVIFAGQSHTARTACAQLFSASQANALDQVTLSPVVTANVTIRNAAPVVDLGYDAYYWGGQYFADFVVADWVGPNRNDPTRETVLTFYGGNTASVADQPNERIKLLTTPFSSYENSLRSDMNRIFANRSFDFDRDVVSMYLYRWGHSMVYPKPGWPFSAPIMQGGQFTRVPSPRFYARQQVGRISIGAQDVESSPANESAIGAGLRTSGEVLALL
ncbi:MAG: spermidine dehydrogenase [Acidobacteriaceae bacterium]|jgi:spermidine dehydrogenase|nr:spermidine dehydrogenase [Acidobacteriaceae bacterium]